MAVTYFGFGVNSDGTTAGTPTADPGYSTTFSVWGDPVSVVDVTFATYFTCPGTGSNTYDIMDISAYLNGTAGSPVLQLGVYDAVTPFALMARGTSSTTISSGAGWKGHQSQGAITQTTVLTGAHIYEVLLSAVGSGGSWSFHYNSLNSSNNTGNYNTTSYVGAIPVNLPSRVGQTPMQMVRIGIQAVGGGGRTSKNTRGWGLGTELGMGIWMPNNL